MSKGSSRLFGGLILVGLIVPSLSACMSGGDKGGGFAGLLQSARDEQQPGVWQGWARNGGGAGQITNSPSQAMLGGTEVRGSGQFVGSVGELSRKKTRKGEDGITLNFRNAPVAEVAKRVMGDELGLNYTISNRVNANITIQTTEPVPRAEIAQIFESALAANGYAITLNDGLYSIVPASEIAGSRITSVLGNNQRIGQGTRIVPLQHVNASQMVQLLDEVTKPGAVLLANDDRDVLILSGNSSELDAMTEMVRLFDIDTMKGMSFAFYPVEISEPQAIVRELKSIFGVSDADRKPRIQFIPNERLGAILVIARNPGKLDEASAWISRLDKAGSRNEQNLFVYKIQNRPAAELADVLQRVLTADAGTVAGTDTVAPRYRSASVSSQAQAEAGFGSALADTGPDGSTTENRSFKAGAASVVADVANNALLIHATQKEYDRILKIARRLDVLPTQVMLEAMIAEVSLNDQLKFGLKWFFENNGSSFTFTDSISGLVDSVFPGFSYLFASADIRVVLDALSEITNVNVVSAPSLMVLDNRQATLQIGDQVPIVTRTDQSVDTSGAPVISSIEMKDTGVIFNVTPRVNDSGRVVLEIEQEVSNVVPTTSSGIDSPTIEQRRIETTVVVTDGQVVTLGGLIQQRDTASRAQVPVLGNVPGVGALFRQKKTGIDRTELLVFIRPTIVRNEYDAMAVTKEFASRMNMDGLEPTRGDGHFERDLRRIFK